MGNCLERIIVEKFIQDDPYPGSGSSVGAAGSSCSSCHQSTKGEPGSLSVVTHLQSSHSIRHPHSSSHHQLITESNEQFTDRRHSNHQQQLKEKTTGNNRNISSQHSLDSDSSSLYASQPETGFSLLSLLTKNKNIGRTEELLPPVRSLNSNQQQKEITSEKTQLLFTQGHFFQRIMDHLMVNSFSADANSSSDDVMLMDQEEEEDQYNHHQHNHSQLNMDLMVSPDPTALNPVMGNHEMDDDDDDDYVFHNDVDNSQHGVGSINGLIMEHPDVNNFNDYPPGHVAANQEVVDASGDSFSDYSSESGDAAAADVLFDDDDEDDPEDDADTDVAGQNGPEHQAENANFVNSDEEDDDQNELNQDLYISVIQNYSNTVAAFRRFSTIQDLNRNRNKKDQPKDSVRYGIYEKIPFNRNKSLKSKERKAKKRSHLYLLTNHLMASFNDDRNAGGTNRSTKPDPRSEVGKRIGHVSQWFDGKLIIWGGYNDDIPSRYLPSDLLWVYDPLNDKW